MYGVCKNIQLNIRSVSQIVQKFPGELKSQGEVLYNGSQLAFPVNETLSLREKCQNQCCVWDLGNETLSLKY